MTVARFAHTKKPSMAYDRGNLFLKKANRMYLLQKAQT